LIVPFAAGGPTDIILRNQAGGIAKRAGVSRFVPFHFSDRYRDQEDSVRCEAEQVFRE
jgi:ribonuclease BN (tRNA processing enzyme)